MNQANVVPCARTPFVNIAAYHFVHLEDLPKRREELQALTQSLDMKGTILLAPEGINLFCSGTRFAVDSLLSHLKGDAAFSGLEVKESYSDEIAFNRMLVKIKQEIIAFGVDEANPLSHPSPRISPSELKTWLDEGRDVLLFDVRNEFECEVGTFQGAHRAGIESFRDFPEAINELPEEWRNWPIVTFCTGGIRCEKAAPFMEQAGFKNVWQLDGGILKYFEDCGGEHYEGECFVFDRRVALDPDLQESDVSMCFACQHVLTSADRQSAQYQEGVSCPYCSKPERSVVELLTKRRRKGVRPFLRELPGHRPYQNVRPLNLPQRVHGMTLLDAIVAAFPGDSREAWKDRIESGRLRYQGDPVTCDEPVVGGQSLVHFEPNMVEPDVNAAIEVMFEDESWIVVNKPAPLPVHPCGRFHRNTLLWMLSRCDRGKRLRPSHRLDANTSGVQIVCKDRESATAVQKQFEKGTVGKTYLLRVRGVPEWEEKICDAPIGEASGPAGIRRVDASGKSARTVFKLVESYSDGSSLLEARPITGRTNQIRVHAWHLGHPILGDPAYLPGGKVGKSQTLTPQDPPLMLHAWQMELQHPKSGETIRWQADRPQWASFDPS